MMAKLKRMYQSHFLITSASPSAHARATAEPAFACPGILSQPPFSMTSALCQLLTSPSSLSFFSWFGCFINCATQDDTGLEPVTSGMVTPDRDTCLNLPKNP